MSERARKWLRGWRLAALAFLAATALSAGYARFVEPEWLRVTELTLPVPREAPGLARITAVLFSDLHFRGAEGGRERRLLDRIGEIRPDLVIVAGDAIDDPRKAAAAVEYLGRIRASLGVFAVPGNWERWTSLHLPRWKADLAARGVTLLVDEGRRIPVEGGALDLLGLDYPGTAGGLDAAIRMVPAGGYRVALAHTPMAFRHAVDARVPLTLAGHSHGGQVVFPLLGPAWLPDGCGPYVRGRYEEGDSALFVTTGVGTSILPVRFGARPEVVVLRWR